MTTQPPNYSTPRLPLLWLSLAFLAGILLASQVTLPVTVWLILAGSSILAAIFLRILSSRLPFSPAPQPPNSPAPPPSTLFLVSLSLITLFLGAARYQASIPIIDAHHIAWYNDRQYDLLVTGVLTELPDTRDSYTNLRLRVQSVDTGDESLPVAGLILARIQPGQTFHYGEVIRLRGALKTPPENEDFSYRDYLARQGIHAYMPSAKATLLPFRGGNPILAAIYALKERSLAVTYRIFPDPEASLLAGILLGVETGLPPDLQKAFKDTGTAHIIAISGFNITIIAALLVTVFNRLLGPRRGALAAVIGIALYTLLVGADAAVVRAAFMGGLALFARQVGRRQDGLNTLVFVAALMAIINPHTPWDVGFQLSFAATLGLILYAQPFQEWITQRLSRFLPPATAPKLAQPLSEFVFFTLAAQLTTLPVMAYHFGRISLVALIANPFILPAQPAVMLFGGLALLLGLLYLPLGQLAAWLAWPFPAYTIRVVELFARLPHGVLILGDFSLLFAILFYAALLSWTFSRGRVKGALHAALTPAVILSALALITFLTWRAAFAAPDGRLHLTFLDVGSADAVLIQTPTGRNVLVNGGPSPARLSDALGRRLPPFDRRLDYLVIASTQEDQVGALPRTLERFPPRAVLWAGKVEASYSARQLDKWLTDRSILVTRAGPGQALDLGAGATLKALAVSPRGAVLLVEWKGFRALLPIGMNFDSLAELEDGEAVGPVSVLLLADSGYAPVNPPEWVANLQPQLVILSVAAGDPYGMPAQAVLDAVQGISLLRTDRAGWIQVTTDGEELWVEVERK
ncbi:MAG: ComEC/Rec2 family competence protein [Anaerolineales bacterium]|nr:ComEC/Rec2 family competence protein [Anaerolineales bacterium]